MVADVHTAVVVTATSPFSAHVRGHTIGVTIDRSVFFASSCVTTSKLRLSHNICHRKRGVRGVSPVVCYAVLCPLSGGLCGLLCVRVMSVYKGYPDMSWFDQGIPC